MATRVDLPRGTPSAESYERFLAGIVSAGEVLHLAVLSTEKRDLAPLLAGFYRLAASRNGWLAHGSGHGQVDHDRALLAEHGLEVAALQARGQMVLGELDLTADPARWAEEWRIALATRQADDGFDALWFSRFPVPPLDAFLPYDQAFAQCFAGHRAVGLCTYVPGTAAYERSRVATTVDRIHDVVLLG
ncbi:MAG TPA: hypothetical protein VFK38_02935 [Candidatus Limnocylindrales bacterium]|nr:hypothetical protein [Candidatus Limnocylindrales bacterium]